LGSTSGASVEHSSCKGQSVFEDKAGDNRQVDLAVVAWDSKTLGTSSLPRLVSDSSQVGDKPHRRWALVACMVRVGSRVDMA